ncbi:MAG TPA: acyl-CoA reductase [Flavipsychrobacter sp.]
MVSLQRKIELLVQLGEYMLSADDSWKDAKELAKNRNAWFDNESIDMAVGGIAGSFLQADALKNWIDKYPTPGQSLKVGIVMAGNIPLVGFHDFLCGFVTGHILYIKLSSKDDVLLRHLVGKLAEWEPDVAEQVVFADNLKGCDAYIATGSNNTARYFEQYFGKYPNIIRKNRTSVAILSGNETQEEFQRLGIDIFSYYGLGCRNVTKVFLPEGYDINILLKALQPFSDIIHHHKYKHNFDYYLAIYLLNRVPYFSNDFLLMVENTIPFSAVSVLHYEFYKDKEELLQSLQNNDSIQCVVDNVNIKYGLSQFPALTDYADGIDTMMFLSTL